MSESKLKCILILSAKSSGSTALQSLLVKFFQVNHIDKTRHFEYETLFWTKAASILQLPQVDMLDSEVPINKEKARYDIINLLKQNLGTYAPPENDNDLIFNEIEFDEKKVWKKFGFAKQILYFFLYKINYLILGQICLI